MDPFFVQLLVSLGEQVGIPVLLTIIMADLSKNPTGMQQFRNALLLAADTIYKTFGIVPPVHN